MNIILLGPQGSGKGTQAKLLVEKFGFYYFESGAYLRRVAETNENLKKSLDQGLLVSDEEMTSYLSAFLDKENLYDGIIFDGFPRTLGQYHFWKSWLTDRNFKIDTIIVLEIGEEESIKRLLLRSKKEGRGDDNLESIKNRLNLYHERTEGLISELQKEIKVVRVDGERSIEAIQKDLVKIIENHKNESH